MTSPSAITPKMRKISSSAPWKPHKYQEEGVRHLVDNPIAVLFWDPGCGKTSVTLEAFLRLKEAGEADKMLVIAPLNVVRLVWEQEASRWGQFQHLTFSLLHGPKKAERLKQEADIYLINCEGVPWLCQKFRGRRLPFDVVAIDELTKFKNHAAQRSKSLYRPMLKVSKKWGLTGTPIPNGYMDLFGQFLILDGGAALGQYITHYRDLYFDLAEDGFTYALRKGAEQKIEERIAPYVHRVMARDLPELINDVREIDLPLSAKTMVRELTRSLTYSLPEGGVDAINSASLYGKLKQIANGAVYLSEDGGIADEGVTRRYAVVHDAKLVLLEELLDEMNGNQLLLGYQFRHDLDRIMERYGDRVTCIPPGATTKQVRKIERDWNAGRITTLVAHPATIGHGINLQIGGASHVGWFSVTNNYEHYDQFIRRVHRQGNKAERVINHILVVKGTYDEKDLLRTHEKGEREGQFLKSIEELLRDADTAAGRSPARKDKDMVRKLSKVRSLKSDEVIEDDEDDVVETPVRRPRRVAASRRKEDEDIFDDVDDRSQQKAVIKRKIRAGQVDEDEDDEDEDDEPEKLAQRVVQRLAKRGKPDDDVDDDPAEVKPPRHRRALGKPAEKKETAPPATESAPPATEQLQSFADLLEALAKVIRGN